MACAGHDAWHTGKDRRDLWSPWRAAPIWEGITPSTTVPDCSCILCVLQMPSAFILWSLTDTWCDCVTCAGGHRQCSRPGGGFGSHAVSPFCGHHKSCSWVIMVRWPVNALHSVTQSPPWRDAAALFVKSKPFKDFTASCPRRVLWHVSHPKNVTLRWLCSSCS